MSDSIQGASNNFNPSYSNGNGPHTKGNGHTPPDVLGEESELGTYPEPVAASRASDFDLSAIKTLVTVATTPTETEQTEAGAESLADCDTEPALPPSWPYDVENGRLVLCRRTKGVITKAPIADLEARIVGELISEDGERTFVIEAKGVRGPTKQVEILDTHFGDTAKLIGAIEAVSARDGVRAGQRQHIGPAIKAMTNEIWTERRFIRTGWVNGKFLIHGRLADGVRLELNDKLPYEITDEAELGRGLAVLPDLIKSPGPERGAIMLAFALQAPLARVAGWGNERYALFLRGTSGTRKTSTTQAFMTLYGPQFAEDTNLIGLGEGSTSNAVIGLATSAHDMPILLDNYKSNTGVGQRGIVSLIHRLLEGGDKARMDRNAELRPTKPVHTWPIITGEDLPAGDPSTLARVLVIPFEEVGNESLTKAQSESKHLCAVGGAWIDWLESAEGRKVVAKHAAQTQSLRDEIARNLVKNNPNMVNTYRVATNLATNSLTWAIALEHPQIGPMIAPYTEAYKQGLKIVALGMSNHTEQGLEATRYLQALRELLATGRAVLMADSSTEATQWDAKTKDEVDQNRLQDRVIGWIDGNGGAYLFPAVTRKAVAQTLGDDLSSMSDGTLYAQLLKLGAIRPGSDKTTVTRKLDGVMQRVLHVQAHALNNGKDDADQ
jgi:hypothetical protein